MYRLLVRHVLQHKRLSKKLWFFPFFDNPLQINWLYNCDENRVFPSNSSVVATNDVDFTIDCCHNSHLAPTPWGPSNHRGDLRFDSPPMSLEQHANDSCVHTSFTCESLWKKEAAISLVDLCNKQVLFRRSCQLCPTYVKRCYNLNGKMVV